MNQASSSIAKYLVALIECFLCRIYLDPPMKSLHQGTIDMSTRETRFQLTCVRNKPEFISTMYLFPVDGDGAW